RDELRLCLAGVDEVELTLRGGIDDGDLDWMQRPLRERRESAHLLDLVAPELDAQRLTARGREDVHEAAAHGELPPLVRALDTVVARERKRLGQLLEAHLLTRRDAHRLGTEAPGRQRPGERCRRSADKAAGGED